MWIRHIPFYVYCCPRKFVIWNSNGFWSISFNCLWEPIFNSLNILLFAENNRVYFTWIIIFLLRSLPHNINKVDIFMFYLYFNPFLYNTTSNNIMLQSTYANNNQRTINIIIIVIQIDWSVNNFSYLTKYSICFSWAYLLHTHPMCSMLHKLTFSLLLLPSKWLNIFIPLTILVDPLIDCPSLSSLKI